MTLRAGVVGCAIRYYHAPRVADAGQQSKDAEAGMAEDRHLVCRT